MTQWAWLGPEDGEVGLAVAVVVPGTATSPWVESPKPTTRVPPAE